MSLRPVAHYLKSSLGTTTTSDLSDVRLTVRSVETVNLGTGTLSQTVAVVAANEIRPLVDVTVTVTNGQFLSDATLTVASLNHRHADLITVDYTPSDIPAGRSIFIVDDRNGNTLATLTNASSGLLRLSLDAAQNAWIITETIDTTDANPTFSVVTVTGSIRNAAGTASAPPYAFTGGTNIGMWNDGGQLAFTVSGTNALELVKISASAVSAQIMQATFDLRDNNNLNRVGWNASGATYVNAQGTNQSITLTPSGTAGVVINTGSSQALAITSTVTGNLLSIGGSARTVYLGVTAALAYVDSAAATTALAFNIGGVEKARFSPTNGNLLLGGLTTDGTGVLQFPAATTAAGGITLGADINLYRLAAGQMYQLATVASGTARYTVENASASGATFSGYFCSINNAEVVALLGAGSAGVITKGILTTRGAYSLELQTNGTAALTLDSSQNATFVGTATTVGRIKKTNIQTTTYTVTTADHVVIGNHATVAFTITLIAASTNTGREFVIKNKGAAVVTVSATGLGQIDGANTATLNQYQALHLISDGATWNIV